MSSGDGCAQVPVRLEARRTRAERSADVSVMLWEQLGRQQDGVGRAARVHLLIVAKTAISCQAAGLVELV